MRSEANVIYFKQQASVVFNKNRLPNLRFLIIIIFSSEANSFFQSLSITTSITPL